MGSRALVPRFFPGASWPPSLGELSLDREQGGEVVQGWQEHPGMALSWIPLVLDGKLTLVLLSAIPWLSRLPAQPGKGSCPVVAAGIIGCCAEPVPGLGEAQRVGHEWCSWRGRVVAPAEPRPEEVGLAQWPSRSSTFSLPCAAGPPWEGQLGKVFGACSDRCELPWAGGVQLQGGCWVYLCLFECVLVSPGQGHPQRGSWHL